MRKKLRAHLDKFRAQLVEEERQAAAVEQKLAALPAHMRPLGGPVAALLSVFGPPELRAGARSVLLQRAYSETRAQIRRNDMRRRR